MSGLSLPEDYFSYDQLYMTLLEMGVRNINEILREPKK